LIKTTFLIFFFITCVANAQDDYSYDESFNFRNYEGEPRFSEVKYMSPYYGRSYLRDPQKFFDSLNVISYSKAVSIARKKKHAKVSTIQLVYSNTDHKKSYWEVKIGGKSWAACDAPLKYRLTVRGWANGIGYDKIVRIDAVTGKVIKTYKRAYRFIWHF
jgi:uncharacterized membrane protein YkoI